MFWRTLEWNERVWSFIWFFRSSLWFWSVFVISCCLLFFLFLFLLIFFFLFLFLLGTFLFFGFRNLLSRTLSVFLRRNFAILLLIFGLILFVGFKLLLELIVIRVPLGLSQSLPCFFDFISDTCLSFELFEFFMGELEIATDGLNGRFRLVNLVFGGHFKLKFIVIYY